MKQYSDDFTAEEAEDQQKVHEMYQEIKRLNRVQVEYSDEKILLENELEKKYEGYVSHFEHEGHVYVVIFEKGLPFSGQEYEKFLRAAEKGFCQRFYGCNGIKIVGNLYEVKISTGTRLLGRGIKDGDLTVMVFNKLENHSKAARTIRTA